MDLYKIMELFISILSKQKVILIFNTMNFSNYVNFLLLLSSIYAVLSPRSFSYLFLTLYVTMHKYNKLLDKNNCNKINHVIVREK